MSHDPATGPDLSAGLRAETAIGGRGVPVSALAEGARDPPVGSIRQDRRRLRRQGVPVGQGGHGVPVRRFGKGENTKEQMARAGGDGRVVLLGIAQERTRIGGRGRPRAKSMWRLRIWSGPGRWALSTTSISRCGPGLGRGVLEDHRLPPWPVYPAEWAQLGAAAMRTARHRLHLPGPRVRRLREPRLAAADLRPTRIQRGERLPLALAQAVRPLGFPLSFAPDRRWRHVLDN